MLCSLFARLSLLVTVMDGSRVTQSLDFLWFYTNILTSRDEQVASLTDQPTPLIHAKEPPKRDLEKPNAPILVNQQNESENVISSCAKCGEISSAFEAQRVISNNSEMLKTGAGRETDKRERRRRRKRNRSGAGQNGMEVILGRLDLGFDVKEVTGLLKFQELCGYQMLAIQRQTKMPPFDDDVAMKEHLKSWAYAVACTVK